VCRAANVPHRGAPSLPGGENFRVDEYDSAPTLRISAVVTAFSYTWHQHSQPPQPLLFQISLHTISNIGPYDEFHSTPIPPAPSHQSEISFIMHSTFLISPHIEQGVEGTTGGGAKGTDRTETDETSLRRLTLNKRCNAA
jgi:hypothetical protein